MPVISRSTASVVLDSGETASVFVENLTQALPPSTLLVPDGGKVGLFRLSRDKTDENDQTYQVGWGVGTRLLFLTVTSQGEPTRVNTPVIVLRPDVKNGGQPVRCDFLESIIDPVIIYDSIQKKIILFYFINAWSPPPFLAPPEPPLPPPPGSTTTTTPEPIPFGQYVEPLTLFSGVIPPAPIQVDPDYYENPDYTGLQPSKGNFTGIRDVPNWYTAIDAPDITDIPGSTDEIVGPFDLTRFWVAPFTDAHLYRFPSDLSGFSDPTKQTTTTTTTTPPPGPTTTTTTTTTIPPVPSGDFLELFPFITTPETDTTQAVLDVLFKVQNEETLTSLEYQTYDCYRYALARILGLTRCTRVLMKAEGQFYNLQIKQNAELGGQTTTTTTTPPPGPPATTTTTAAPVNKSPSYLVLDHPQPVMAFPRGVNKVLVGRPKLTSFIGADTFITAALTYRYPAAGSVSLCGGNPQVDFTIHSPSDRFDENRRMGLLPESLTPQHAPFDVQGTYSIAGGFGVSIIEVLTNTSAW